MSRVLMLVAAIALLAVAGVLTTLAIAPAGEATPAERVEKLAGEMRCPDCQALSVAESGTQAAAAIHDEIARQVAAGRTDREIRDYFVASYGQWILLAPPEPLVWWLPVAALLTGVAILAAWFGLGRRRRTAEEPPHAPPPVADADRRRIREELEVLDG